MMNVLKNLDKIIVWGRGGVFKIEREKERERAEEVDF